MLGAGGVSGVRRGGWRVRGGVGRSVAQRSPAGLVGSGGVVSGLDVETVVALLEVMQRGGMDAALDRAELLDAPEQHVLALRLHAELLAVKVAFYDGELARAAFPGAGPAGGHSRGRSGLPDAARACSVGDAGGWGLVSAIVPVAACRRAAAHQEPRGGSAG